MRGYAWFHVPRSALRVVLFWHWLFRRFAVPAGKHRPPDDEHEQKHGCRSFHEYYPHKFLRIMGTSKNLLRGPISGLRCSPYSRMDALLGPRLDRSLRFLEAP